MTVQTCLDRLDEFADYQQNWCDGYGEIINPETITIAKYFIHNVKNYDHIFVYPTLPGGVEVSFTKYKRDINVDIYAKPNGLFDIWVDVYTDACSDINYLYDDIDYRYIEAIVSSITKLL